MVRHMYANHAQRMHRSYRAAMNVYLGLSACIYVHVYAQKQKGNTLRFTYTVAHLYYRQRLFTYCFL
jgi:hypothetical protein